MTGIESNSYKLFANRYGIFIAALFIFLSRLPFLEAGYGSEEDAMGMALTARNISQSGIYEYSRLPGHPVPELLYAFIYGSGPWGFNLLTAVISSLGILFFMLALRQANLRHAVPAGLALAFTPVVYIASTNVMDYTWAMAFILLSFYWLINRKFAAAGLALGLATGCRITSGGMLLPFLFLCMAEEPGKWLNRNRIRFILSTLLTSLLLFLPVIRQYGFSFFSFYEQDYPSFSKAAYKYTLAVYGTLGLAGVLFMKGRCLTGKFGLRRQPGIDALHRKLGILSAIVFVMYSMLYWYLPQKAAFMIPALPFVFLFFALYEKRKYMYGLLLSLLFSCFFFGVNLSDPNRGSTPSSLAVFLKTGNQEIVFDPLKGVVTDDFDRRKQRIRYAGGIVSVTDTLQAKTALLAGWWLGDILVRQDPSRKRQTLFYYHIPEQTLDSLRRSGCRIYYLPGQDEVNDAWLKKSLTRDYAAEWPY